MGQVKPRWISPQPKDEVAAERYALVLIRGKYAA